MSVKITKILLIVSGAVIIICLALFGLYQMNMYQANKELNIIVDTYMSETKDNDKEINWDILTEKIRILRLGSP